MSKIFNNHNSVIEDSKEKKPEVGYILTHNWDVPKTNKINLTEEIESIDTQGLPFFYVEKIYT